MKKVKMIALGAAVSIGIAGAAGSYYVTNASQAQKVSENSIQLNVEKQDKDTIKIYLSNFSDLAKSLQLSVKIEEGNVKFNEDSINWLIGQDDETILKNYKIDDKKQTIDFFIVSNEPINSDGGLIEICEIDVTKGENIFDSLLKSGDSSFKVVPNLVNGEAFSYVTYATNKSISSGDIVNASDEILSINTKPVLKLKDVPSVVEGKIVISKGTVFNAADYVEAYDSEGNEITNIEYTGNLNNKKPGSYNITCKATDSLGDVGTLEVTVFVEDDSNVQVTEPIITGADKPLEIIIGEEFDLEKGVTATDYMGRTLPLTISGDYDVTTKGTYTIIYSATDRFDNTVTVERQLIVKEKEIISDGNNGGNNSGSNGGNNTGSNGGSNSGSSSSSSSSSNSTSNSGNTESDSENNESNNEVTDTITGVVDNNVGSDANNQVTQDSYDKNNTVGESSTSSVSDNKENSSSNKGAVSKGDKTTSNSKDSKNNSKKDKNKDKNKVTYSEDEEIKEYEEAVEEVENTEETVDYPAIEDDEKINVVLEVGDEEDGNAEESSTSKVAVVVGSVVAALGSVAGIAHFYLKKRK